MNDWLNLLGKTVIVTGGSSGIGRSVVEALLAQGANVANFDLRDAEESHPNYMFCSVDVTDAEKVEEGVAAVVERFGTVDGLVNNAGMNIPRLLVDPENPHGKYELDGATFDKVTLLN